MAARRSPCHGRAAHAAARACVRSASSDGVSHVRTSLRPPEPWTDKTVADVETAMAYTVMAYIVMAYTVMAFIVMAFIVMADIVMAYIVMAYISMV